MRALFAALVLAAPAAVFCQVARSGSALPRPVAPLVVHGACPFECCQYGAWRLRTSVHVRTRPARSAAQIAALTAGTPVTADSGLVIVTRLGLAIVRRAYRNPDMGIDYAVGDTIVVLDYVGEGFFNTWYRGRAGQEEMYWDRDGTRDTQLVQKPVSEWWAHISWRERGRSRAGWLDMSSAKADGADGCA